VIDFILKSDLVKTRRVGCTIVKHNVFGIHDLLDYCQDRRIYVKFRLGIPHKRLYTEQLVEPYALTIEEKYHVAEFIEGLIKHYEENDRQKFFYRSLVDQILHNAPRKAGCDWKHRGATVTSHGELLYCAVQSKTLGDITAGDISSLYFQGREHLGEIVRSKCGTCTHDYVGIPPRRQFLVEIGRALLRKTGTFHLAKRAWEHPRVFALRQTRGYRKREKQLHVASERLTGQHKGEKKRVLICGWYGTETLGDKAILGGIVHALTLLGLDHDVTIASLNPYITRVTQSQMAELQSATVVPVEEAIRLAAGFDLVVFGGGPLMALTELADMIAIFRAATAARVPTVIAGCGVGPMGPETLNSAIKELLCTAKLRIYRDRRSYEHAASMGVNVTSDIVAEDPAFTWLTQFERASDTKSRDRQTLLLGLREFPSTQYGAHLSQERCTAISKEFEQALVDALEALVRKRPRLRILPLPMCSNHFGDDDRWFYRRILRRAGAVQDNLDRSLLSRERTPVEYVEAFRSADAVVAMRYHSLIFALGLGVPVVALDYTLGRGKVEALADRFGVQSASVDSVTPNGLLSLIDALFEHRSPPVPEFTPSFAPSFTRRVRELLTG
jgi:polysaccharide pyruvyl transferase WcaK-like protein